jgi:O-acetylhomoserine/O-acetylserine sulfhydrylase-like pyridoxal-dependent enzyme
MRNETIVIHAFKAEGFRCSRISNPGVTILERRVAEIEGSFAVAKSPAGLDDADEKGLRPCPSS